MDKNEIIQRIETFAPLETQEKWDCSGRLVDTGRKEISKIMLCLTVTSDVVKQAREQNCDMIISHHPLFFVPFEWKDIDIYCAHTNFDRAKGGTTDTLIRTLGFQYLVIANEREAIQPFVKYVVVNISIEDFIEKLKKISPKLRYVNNFGVKKLYKIAFCAGSGSEFIREAFENGADALVTGDIKFHTALESPIVLFDVGHFESEVLSLPVLANVAGIDAVYAEEKSPFINIDN